MYPFFCCLYFGVIVKKSLPAPSSWRFCFLHSQVVPLNSRNWDCQSLTLYWKTWISKKCSSVLDSTLQKANIFMIAYLCSSYLPVIGRLLEVRSTGQTDGLQTLHDFRIRFWEALSQLVAGNWITASLNEKRKAWSIFIQWNNSREHCWATALLSNHHQEKTSGRY